MKSEPEIHYCVVTPIDWVAASTVDRALSSVTKMMRNRNRAHFTARIYAVPGSWLNKGYKLKDRVPNVKGISYMKTVEIGNKDGAEPKDLPEPKVEIAR